MQDMISDMEMVARIKAGDQAACALCMEKHGPNLRRLALSLVKNEADAADVVQDTFVNAFKSIDSFEGRSTLGTWLYRITYNNAMMRLRQTAPEMISVESAMEGSVVPPEFFDWCCLPEEDFSNAEIRRQLEIAFETLSPNLRSVFVYRELRGYSTSETAEKLGVSEDVVKTRLHRARQHLRETLGEYLDMEG